MVKPKYKFRAIDEYSDDLIYGQSFFIDSDNNQGYICDGISRYTCVKKETVGQFTGFTDHTRSNPKEIYQHSILKYTSGGWTKHGKVKWIDDEGIYGVVDLVESSDDGYYELAWLLKESNCIEVGNIFQNPELIPLNLK